MGSSNSSSQKQPQAQPQKQPRKQQYHQVLRRRKVRKVVQATAGRFHTVLVLSDGTAVAFGWNRDGQTRIPDLKGKKVVQATAGDYHTVLVLSDGIAVAFGNNGDGQTRIPDLKGKKVVQATAGDCHTVLVLSDGTAVAFGWSRDGQTIGESYDGQTTIPDLKGKKVVQATAGRFHTVLVLSDGTAVAFGSNNRDGQTTIPDLKGKKVVQATAGDCHTVLVLSDGTAVAFGNNDDGQTTIPDLKGKKVVQATAGERHTVLVLSDGTAVAFGNNCDGQTTIPDLKGKKVVQATAGYCHSVLALCRDWQTTIPDLKGKKVVQATAGDYHTVLVLSDGTAMAFGSGQTTIPDLIVRDKVLHSELLGIQLSWFLETFRKDAQRRLDSIHKADQRADDMSFHQIAPLLAYGTASYGSGKLCPRDGQMNCSIVDAVLDDGHSDKAEYFLSWVWNYPLRVAADALCEFLHTHPQINAEECCLWWCFFVNNQHRILGDGRSLTTEELAGVFGTRLQAVGRMVCMMDKIRGDQYSRRIWCIFEVFVAQTKGIPFEIILPSSSKGELDRIFKEVGLSGLSNAIDIDVEKASATNEDDQNNIKKLIQDQSSFQEVNIAAKEGLTVVLRNEFDKAISMAASAVQDDPIATKMDQLINDVGQNGKLTVAKLKQHYKALLQDPVINVDTWAVTSGLADDEHVITRDELAAFLHRGRVAREKLEALT